MRRASLLMMTWMGLLVVPAAGLAQEGEVYPDLDLAIECQGRWEGPAGTGAQLAAQVILRALPAGAPEEAGVRAWSLGLQATGGASIEGASTEGTDIPDAFRTQGYEKTELTSGPENEGVVSAVILSLQGNLQLPSRGEWVLLRLQVRGPEIESGCRVHGVEFVDGLVGSGQPVRNAITWAEGTTRRDDGGNLDNDADGYELCATESCVGSLFIRGNLNGDSTVNIADALFLLSYLFQGKGQVTCERAADVSGDDVVSLSDVVFLLNYLFKSGPEMGTPYPGCGLGPAPSVLTCVAVADCD